MELPRISGALLAVSIVINFLFTATDAESPAGVGSLAMAYDREMYLYSPLMEYAAPLFFQGRAWPLLNLLIDDRLGDQEDQLATGPCFAGCAKAHPGEAGCRVAGIHHGGQR